MKECRKCGATKFAAEFYRHSGYADGRMTSCIECTKAAVRQNREERKDYYRQYDRERASLPHRAAARQEYQKTPKGKEALARARRAYQERSPERRAAHIATGNALRDGRLKKLPCFVCGELKVEAHHPDYSAPLDVVWLCPRHHREIHLAYDETTSRE